jgi:CDP-paratose 2-epimerase
MEFKPILEKLLGKKIVTTQSDWRPGDQPVFISDIRKANQLLNWTPKVGAEEGISRLFTWVTENKDLF